MHFWRKFGTVYHRSHFPKLDFIYPKLGIISNFPKVSSYLKILH